MAEVPSSLKFQQYSYDERVKRQVNIANTLARRPVLFGTSHEERFHNRVHGILRASAHHLR